MFTYVENHKLKSIFISATFGFHDIHHMLKNFCDMFMEFDNQAMLLIRFFMQKKNNSLLIELQFVHHFIGIHYFQVGLSKENNIRRIRWYAVDNLLPS